MSDIVCANAELPSTSADFCEPGTVNGQLQKFRFTRAETTDALTDASSLTEWTTRLSNTNALTASGTAAPIRTLDFVGEETEPTQESQDYSLGRTHYFTPEGQVVGNCYDLSAANQALAKKSQEKGGLQVRAWWETKDMLFGGNAGVVGTMRVARVVPTGDNELAYLRVTFEYDGAQPEGIATPFV